MNEAYAAGINHVQIKNANGDIFDVEAVINLEGGLEMETQEIKGDDTVKVMFGSTQKAAITIEANALTMDMLAAITGQTVTDLTAPNGKEIGIGTDTELNPPFVEVFGQIRAKFKSGAVGTIETTFHKVQLKAPPITGALESEFSISIEGTAYKTSEDIEANALPNSRVATLRLIEGDTTPS